MARILAYKVVGSDNNADGSITLYIASGYTDNAVFTETARNGYTVPALDAQTILGVEITPGVSRRLDMRTAFSDYLIAKGVIDAPLVV